MRKIRRQRLWAQKQVRVRARDAAGPTARVTCFSRVCRRRTCAVAGTDVQQARTGTTASSSHVKVLVEWGTSIVRDGCLATSYSATPCVRQRPSTSLQACLQHAIIIQSARPSAAAKRRVGRHQAHGKSRLRVKRCETTRSARLPATGRSASEACNLLRSSPLARTLHALTKRRSWAATRGRVRLRASHERHTPCTELDTYCHASSAYMEGILAEAFEPARRGELSACVD